jgi:hypothetical protein
MFFVPWQYHLKNPVIYESAVVPMFFLNQWRLPLLFIISGMGTYYALSKRNLWQFIGERLKRLLVPLLFGILFIVPPQVYLERLVEGRFSGSFFNFWPAQLASGSYPEGNLSWHHLWFLPYLLLYSMAFLPAFLYLRRHPQCRFMQLLGKAVGWKFGIYVFILPLFLWVETLLPHFPLTHTLIGDWFYLAQYATFFFSGFLLVSLKDIFWEAVRKNRHFYVITGVAAFLLLMLLRFGVSLPVGQKTLLAIAKVVNQWSWCLAAMGYAAAYLNRESKGLSYANEAVYPFYILHQTVQILIFYYIKDLDYGFFPKFAISVVGTFAITWLIYEFGIRRYRLIRPLFGMKNGLSVEKKRTAKAHL